jgi:hypothetical protein
MDQNQLFTTMFKDDIEGQKLILVPGADELMTQFEQKFTGIVRSMFEFGLKVYLLNRRKKIVISHFVFFFFKEKELRDHEIEDFWICVKEAKDENTRRAAVIVDEFKAYRAKLLVSEFRYI